MTHSGKMISCVKFLRKFQRIKINIPLKCYYHTLRVNNKNIYKTKNLNIFKINYSNTSKVKLNDIKSGGVPKERIPNKSEIKRLLLLARPEKWKLTGAITLLLISSTVTMAVPFCLGKIIDIIYTEDKNKTKDNLNKLSIVLLAVFMIGGMCNFGRIYFMSTSGYRITQSLRKKAYSAILSQETGMFDKISTGELVGRLSGDAQLVSSAITSNVSDGLRSSITTLAGVSMMFHLSPQLACVGLGVVPPITGLAIVYGRFVKKISKDLQSSLAVLNTTAEERIGNIRTVKAFAQEKNEIKRYSSKLDDLLNLCYKESLYRGIFFGLTGFTGNAIILSVLYYGGVMISDAAITVGNLSAFLLYAAYTGMSLSGISNFYTELNRALGASTRLFEYIDRKPKIPIEGGKILDKPLRGEIIFDNISFKYPTREDCWILNNFSLNLSVCSVNAIVGPSGSGKSTIALLLLRLYDPQSGNILIDNYNIKELNPPWIKSQIGFVSQEPVLFNGTIKENISYGRDDASDNDIIEAAKLANVLEFTQRMTDGLDTLVGERGVTLSGGQRQRVAIARALIKNPKILILDEATSALDAESENYVQEALERATQGRTVLTIAHRLSTIKNSDKIAVIDKGQVVEIGNYNELMLIENGLFKKLVKHQTFT
ncbi:ATP-binding cassette sub-family B member 10, mitochondrial [Microplitis demolitor]|uniref:ATP-binding cassette sub-family B member 10, mitochondrial n=1 Tax=Microplitis demolitor TaxID=69319 RepID=UPI0006D5231E|nr:ATP-binding cassette sub-family B member 10, mitochondrial [Microplitis demolitor]